MIYQYFKSYLQVALMITKYKLIGYRFEFEVERTIVDENIIRDIFLMLSIIRTRLSAFAAERTQ